MSPLAQNSVAPAASAPKPLARALFKRIKRMRERPRMWDYCYFTARTTLAVLREAAADRKGREAPRVIDLGCGQRPFEALFPPGTRRLGVDFLRTEHCDLVHDLEEPLPLSSRCADLVLLSESLEHLSQPHRVLAEATRLLKPGGRLYLSTPFAFPIHSRPHDYLRFTQHFYRRVARELGLTVVRLERSNSALSTPILAWQQLLLALPGVPIPLKQVAWAAVNLLAWPLERLARSLERGRPGESRVRGLLDSNPMGYAVLLERPWNAGTIPTGGQPSDGR